MKRATLVSAGLLCLLFATAAAAGTAVYDPAPWRLVPACGGGESPCVVPASLIGGRDTMTGGNEPNQPNTLADSPCADGINGTFHVDESLDAFTVATTGGEAWFQPGVQVTLTATVFCYSSYSADQLQVFSSPSADAPVWTYVGSATCPAAGVQTLSVSFTLPAPGGTQAIRAAFLYNSASQDVCLAGGYNDRDDLALAVVWDTDGDGLDNNFEITIGTSPVNPDSDSDGLNDGDEYNTYLTDPLDTDTDNDGLDDYEEVATYGTSPLLVDTDGDGADDGDEVTFGTDPLVPDTDDDGMQDGYELDSGCLNPLLNDAYADHDSDGLDSLDEMTGTTNPCSDDTDGDLLRDGDEVTVYLSDPLLVNTDGDDWDDYREAMLFRTDPAVADLDSDSDGLPDEVETSDYLCRGWDATGTSPFIADTDQDTFSDLDEMLVGSNPNENYIFPGWRRTGTDARITWGNVNAFALDLVWGNSTDGYNVAYEFNDSGTHRIRTYRVNAGIPWGFGNDTLVSLGYGVEPAIAWTGSEWAVAYVERDASRYGVYFARLDSSNNPIGSPVLVGDSVDAYYPDIAWTGSAFGIVFQRADGNYDKQVSLALVSAGGTVGTITQLTVGVGVNHLRPAIAWSGSNFGVTYNRFNGSGADMVFTLRAADGSLVSPEINLADFSATGPSRLVYTGSEFGVTWTDFLQNGQPMFRRVDASGVPVGTVAPMGTYGYNADVISLAWNGAGYQLAWDDYRNGHLQPNIIVAGLDATGALRGNEVIITDDELGNRDPSIQWNGSEYGIAYSRMVDGSREVFFMRLANDADGDGLPPAEEATWSTDPDYWDTDGDLLGDGYEISINISPVNDDTDNDGIDDFTELRVFLTNPNAWDSDGDNLGDGDELYLYGSDPTAADSDGDGLIDDWELLFQTDPWDRDSDGDGISDFIEARVTDQNPADPDSDDDGQPDNMEAGNTILDIDHDGMPTAWERLYDNCINFQMDDDNGDPDGDSLTSLEEYELGTNPCNPDTDGDWIWDNAEAGEGTNVRVADTDGDGMQDGFELFSGTDPLNRDSDSDGDSDGYELNYGYDPLDPNRHRVSPPMLVNYQGRLFSSDGQPVNGAAWTMFTIYGSSTGEAQLVHQEGQTLTVVNGLYNTTIGPLPFNLFDSGDLWLQVTYDSEVMLPRTRITMVPRAINAEYVSGKRVETGSRPVPVDRAASVTITVAFDRPFVYPPVVTVSPLTSKIGGVSFFATTLENVTETGFVVTFESINGKIASGGAFFSYQAVGR